jgi:DNA-binding Xre family transcriptional regulator
MVKWKLKELLDKHGITPYRLSIELQGQVNRNTIYSIARGEATRVDLETLRKLIEKLRGLTSKKLDTHDILAYVEL